MRKVKFWMLTTILMVCSAWLLTACSSDDNKETNKSETLAKALMGEWISETTVDDYTVVLIYHFHDNGLCWKEMNVMDEDELIDQSIARNDTDGSKYNIDASGKVLIKFEDGEETDELKFDGTKLIYQYAGTTYTLVRATDAQAQLYKEASDAWHGGADESKLNVDNYKPKGVDNSQWMKPLDDSRLVADLSLPGSHDACTAEGWNNPYIGFIHEMTAKCQDLTIQEQLKVGMRVFDLRPEHDLDGTKYVLRCSHGTAGTKMYVSDFFKTLKQWLAAHPTEFCIVTSELSATKDKTAWGKDFYALLTSDEFKGLFAGFKARLTVGEMRGKVLLLSKEIYADKPIGGYCYGWGSDLELEKQQQGHITAADGSETPLWAQDYWKDITRENKDKALINMLEASVKRDMTADKPAWVINFPSAYIDSPFSDSYRKNAESTNQKAIDWLSSHNGSVGIIYMDFAGMNESPDYTKTKLYKTVGLRLVETVINQNFK